MNRLIFQISVAKDNFKLFPFKVLEVILPPPDPVRVKSCPGRVLKIFKQIQKAIFHTLK